MVRRSLFEEKYAPFIDPQNVKKMSMKRQFTPTHVRMLPSNMLLPNLILLIDVIFSTPTPANANQARADLRTFFVASDTRQPACDC
jgi:hypothetical protein